MIKFTDDDEIQAAFEYYRKTGFPYPELEWYERIHIFRKLQSIKAKINLQRKSFLDIKVKTIEIQPIGDIALANYYHPHIWESHATNMRSPLESFHVDKNLLKVCKLSLKYIGEITKKQVTSFSRTVNGTQMCSNFRPSAAKAIYNYFKQDDVLDMSSGYGGHLLGFLASSCEGVYYGVDPSKRTCNCNRQIARDFNSEKRVKIICKPFEDVITLPKVGLAFTSPPYFSKEIYDNNPTQSRERYNTYEEWLKEFLNPMFLKTREALTQKGILAININDVKIGSKSYPLVQDTKTLAIKNGYYLVEQLDIVFSGFGKGLDKRKTEPVLVFKKI